MKDSGNYTIQDIERYHSGRLSPAQMHALEKAALDDPFLADALEGYAYTKSSFADKVALQQRLAKRIGKEEQKKAFFIRQPWLKIAALFILIAGGGWLIIQSLPAASKNEVALTTSVKEQQMPATDKAITADSVSAFSVAPLSNETVAGNSKTPNLSDQKQYKSTAKKQFNQTAPEAQGVTILAKPDSSVPSAATSPVEPSPMKDKVDLPAGSTAMQKAETAGGRIRTNDTLRNVDVVLKRSDLPLNEVVVVNPKAKKVSPQGRMMGIKIDTLEPADGWGYFDDYIASNIKTPGQLKIKPVSGEVELSFDVNKEGEPLNITVTKSLCDRCDEEAIRLLKAGPKWNNKAQKGKVKIKF